MPFTAAHTAAAVLFRRTRLRLSPLIIGCMAPDFEYFARLTPYGGFGHTLPGVFFQDLPLAFLVYWLFHAYAKKPIVAWLPEGIRRRVPMDTSPRRMHTVREFAWVTASMGIGIATHICWDSFTHNNFWPYRHWPFLHRTLVLPVAGEVPYYTLLQHTSTVVGLLVLAIWVSRWYRDTAPVRAQQAGSSAENRRGLLFGFCSVAFLLGVVRALLFYSHTMRVRRGRISLAEAGVTAVALLWVQIVAYGVLLARRSARQAEASE